MSHAADIASSDDPWGGFDVAVLGGGLPPAVQDLIARAGACRLQVEQANALLAQAESLAPGHPAVLIARYRFHFYGHRLSEARQVAQQALKLARQALKRDVVGQVDVSALPSDEQVRFDAAVRFYLFSLKGHAYLCLRLGDIEEGRLALDELRRLDPQDRLGGGLLAEVLRRADARRDGDEDALDAEAPPPPHRGWRPA
jgi:hypothetical protein